MSGLRRETVDSSNTVAPARLSVAMAASYTCGMVQVFAAEGDIYFISSAGILAVLPLCDNCYNEFVSRYYTQFFVYEFPQKDELTLEAHAPTEIHPSRTKQYFSGLPKPMLYRTYTKQSNAYTGIV